MKALDVIINTHALIIAGIKPQIQVESARIESVPAKRIFAKRKTDQLPDESFAQWQERLRTNRMIAREGMRVVRAKRLARATRETEQILADNAACIADMHANASGHLVDPAISHAQRYLGVKGTEPMVFKHVSSVAVLNKLDAANMAVLMHRIGKRERADIVATLCTRFSASDAGKYSNGKPPSRARRDKTLTESDFAKTHTKEFAYMHLLRHGKTSNSEPLNNIRSQSELQRTKSLLRFIPSSLEVFTTQERLTPKRALMTITPKGSEPLAVYPSVLREYEREFTVCSTYNASQKTPKVNPLHVPVIHGGPIVAPIVSYPRLASCYVNA